MPAPEIVVLSAVRTAIGSYGGSLKGAAASRSGCGVRRLLERTGVARADIDLFEVNEAFAAQAIAVMRELELPPERVNPNGSGISLGHPVGATGAIVSVKAIHELRRISGRYALVTLCIGGGQGIAALFEKI